MTNKYGARILNQLGLPVQLCFKFLNTFCLSLKNKVMFFSGQCFQILNTIVVLFPIQVVNNPSLRQFSSISFFPYYYVFKNPSILTRTLMIRAINSSIPIRTIGSFPFPSRVRRSNTQGTISYSRTTLTSSTGKLNLFPTINAMFNYYLPAFPPPHLLCSTRMASPILPPTGLTAINTSIFRSLA